jgi:hypothetical protein
LNIHPLSLFIHTVYIPLRLLRGLVTWLSFSVPLQTFSTYSFHSLLV